LGLKKWGRRLLLLLVILGPHYVGELGRFAKQKEGMEGVIEGLSPAT
jgi:hypothetical protein